MIKLLEKVCRSYWSVYLFLLCLGLLVYACVLNAPFKLIDDFVSIVHNSHLRSLSGLKHIFTSSFFDADAYYRPLVYVTFMAEFHAFKLQAFYYNLNNVFLHSASSFVVFLIMRRFQWKPIAALAVAVLFVIHPVQTEAVANIPGRAILLSAFFFLAAFFFFMRATDEKADTTSLVISLFCFVFSLLSKESAVMLPFVLTAYLSCFYTRNTYILPRGWRKIIPYIVILAIYMGVRRYLGITKVFHWDSLEQMALAMMTFLKVAIHYIGLLIFPTDLYYDHATRLYDSFRNPELWKVFAFWMIVICWVFVKIRKFSSLMVFAILWAIFNMATVSQIFPVMASPHHISSADHFLYLPALGVFILLVMGGERLYHWNSKTKFLDPKLGRLTICVFFIFFILISVQQNIYSSQQVALFKRALEHNPENIRVRTSLASAYGMVGLFEEAEGQYRIALDVEPHNSKALIGLGKALCDQERYWEGAQEYEKVLDPGQLQGLWEANKAIAYETLIRKFKERLKREPRNAQAHYSLGVMYAKIQENEQALMSFQEAIDLKPNYKNALYNLGMILELDQRGDAALAYFQRAAQVENQPEEYDVYLQQRLSN